MNESKYEAKYVRVFCGQVFEFLIRRHSADSSEEEEVFPFIRTLLHFDTREFLNVLAMVRLMIIIVVTWLHRPTNKCTFADVYFIKHFTGELSCGLVEFWEDKIDSVRWVFNKWADLCAAFKDLV